MQTIVEKTGYDLAVLYKYFALYNNPKIVNKLLLSMVKAKSFYVKHKDAFDKFAKISSKYKIDAEKYFKFLMFLLRKNTYDVETTVLSKYCIAKFVDWLLIQDLYRKIYRWFLKSINNIANECVCLGISSANEYFLYLIDTKQLAAKYMSGKISIYYLCSILNIKDIIDKLDPLSKAELSIILDRYDKYNSDVVEAFKLHKSYKLRTIELTNALIQKKLNKHNSK